MTSPDFQVAVVGCLFVFGGGLLIAVALRALHRINLAGRIATRYLAARKVQAAYLENDAIVVADTEVHVCSFGSNCDLARRRNEDASRRAGL